MQTHVTLLEVEIEAMAFTGKGIAKHDGKIIFVDNAIPGDLVKISLNKNKKNFATGTIVTMVKPSPLRAPVPCPYASRCGGCDWLGVDYPAQLAWKKDFILQSLQRIGKIASLDQLQIIGADDLLYYRNRISLKISTNNDGALQFGYFSERTHQMILIDRCLIAMHPINDLLAFLRLSASGLSHPLKGSMTIQVASSLKNKEPVLLICIDCPQNRASEALMALLKKAPLVAWVGRQEEGEKGPLFLCDESKAVPFFVKPGGFIQVNNGQNRKLRSLVVELVDSLAPTSILDLYCGNGNLSLLVNADGEKTVSGIEQGPQPIACARESVKQAALANFFYQTKEAKTHLKKMISDHSSCSLVILDPPRRGAAEILDELTGLAPRDIIYVSCHPATLARDLSTLMNRGYKLQKAIGIDFFPNTYHVETLCHLQLA